jgi:SAM-dependent methyltransferase
VGDRVLEVAAGRGAVLFPAAERVGPGGRVLGIDLSAGMVEHTSAEIQERGLRQAEMQLMDAETLALPEHSLEAVLCSFAVFFFGDVEGALRRFARVLVPGGRLGFAFSRGTDPRWQWYEELLGEFVSLARRGPGQPPIREPGALVEAMQRAGCWDVVETVEETELFFADADDWWVSLWTHGSRIPLEQLSAEALGGSNTSA